MFKRLAETANSAAYQSLVNEITPRVKPVFEKACELAPEFITDDTKYRSHVAEPAWLAVTGITGGVVSMIPNLHERFIAALIHARSTLLVVDSTTKKVSLVEGARDRLPHVLLEGLRKPIVTG